VHWLEYQDWAAPILERPLEVKEGFALPQTEAGCGLVWNKDAVEHYRLGSTSQPKKRSL
jgi:mandelate racemase